LAFSQKLMQCCSSLAYPIVFNERERHVTL